VGTLKGRFVAGSGVVEGLNLASRGSEVSRGGRANSGSLYVLM
jgi:hypothetical protein